MREEYSAPLKKLTIASRGSQLALWQANYVKDILAKHGVMAEIKIVRTQGDRDQLRPLHEMGGKGVFVREIEQCLKRGDADIAVHSLKDLPAQTLSPFTLAAFLKRHDSGDALIMSEEKARQTACQSNLIDQAALDGLGPMCIGTGSLRRKSLLQLGKNQLDVVSIRGNVDTRINKLKQGVWDAIILASASLERLPHIMQGVSCFKLCPEWFIPSASQGALVIETMEGHPMAKWLRSVMDCEETRKQVEIERAVLSGLGGECNMPIGVHVDRHEGKLRCRASLLDGQGQEVRTSLLMDSDQSSQQLAKAMVDKLFSLGAEEILERLGIATNRS